MFVADSIYQLKEIIADMINRYKINISYTHTLYAKTWALNALRGSLGYFFMLLLEYFRTLAQVTHIDIDKGNQLKFFFFMAIGCSI